MSYDKKLKAIDEMLKDKKVYVKISFPEKSMRAYFESNIEDDPLILMYLLIQAFIELFKKMHKMRIFQGDKKEDILGRILNYIKMGALEEDPEEVIEDEEF